MSDNHSEDQIVSQEPVKDYSVEVQSTSSENSRSLDQIVETWFDSHIRGSIVGQHTQIWNHIVAAKERLKDALRSL